MGWFFRRMALAACATTLLCPLAANALILQDVHRTINARYITTAGLIQGFDSETDVPASGLPFTQELNASVAGAGFSAQIHMAPNGFFSIDGNLFDTAQGTLITSVDIVIRARNDDTVTAPVQLGFIINSAGFIANLQSPGSVGYNLTLQRDSNLAPAPITFFETQGTLDLDSGLFGTEGTLTTSGEDIGTELIPVAFGAGMGIPFGVNSSIQTLAPGEIAEFSYSLDVVLDIPAFDDPNGRQIFFQFFDPLLVSGLPPGAVQFGSVVPEPQTALLFFLSAVIIVSLRRRPSAS